MKNYIITTSIILNGHNFFKGQVLSVSFDGKYNQIKGHEIFKTHHVQACFKKALLTIVMPLQ